MDQAGREGNTNQSVVMVTVMTVIESNEHAKLEEQTRRRSQDFWSLFQHGDTL